MICALPLIIGVWFPPTERELHTLFAIDLGCKKYYNSCVKVVEQREPGRWFVTCGGQ